LDRSGITSRRGAFAWLSGAIKVVWSLIVVLGSALGLTWGVYHYATTSARFATKEIQVQGATRLTREQVLVASGIKLGDNLFKLDLPLVEKRLLNNPWLAQVRVTRRLPSTVGIELQEREAAALALVMGQLFLVNRQGESFKAATAEDPSDLPLITGVAVEDGSNDTALYRQRIALALDVLNHYSQSRLSKSYQPQEVHLTPGGEAIMTVGHKGTTLYLGVGPWSKKFVMAERVLARLQAQRSSPALVFLDNRANPDRVVVRVN
jgi:cell division protein FtsQ